jgi:hypothetical protein
VTVRSRTRILERAGHVVPWARALPGRRFKDIRIFRTVSFSFDVRDAHDSTNYDGAPRAPLRALAQELELDRPVESFSDFTEAVSVVVRMPRLHRRDLCPEKKRAYDDDGPSEFKVHKPSRYQSSFP